MLTIEKMREWNSEDQERTVYEIICDFVVELAERLDRATNQRAAATMQRQRIIELLEGGVTELEGDRDAEEWSPPPGPDPRPFSRVVDHEQRLTELEKQLNGGCDAEGSPPTGSYNEHMWASIRGLKQQITDLGALVEPSEVRITILEQRTNYLQGAGTHRVVNRLEKLETVFEGLRIPPQGEYRLSEEDRMEYKTIRGRSDFGGGGDPEVFAGDVRWALDLIKRLMSDKDRVSLDTDPIATEGPRPDSPRRGEYRLKADERARFQGWKVNSSPDGVFTRDDSFKMVALIEKLMGTADRESLGIG